MKTIIFTFAALFASTSFAADFMVGAWCGQDQFKTVDYRMVISEVGSFELSSKTEHDPSYSIMMSGFVSQGASSATMVTDQGVDLNLVEAIRHAHHGRNDLLMFKHIDPKTDIESISTYRQCD